MRRAAAVLLPLRLASCAHGDAGEELTQYTCSPAYKVEAAYSSANDHAVQFADLTLNGKTYHLQQESSGSGVRYVSPEGLAPGYSLIWHTKGNEALLLQAAGATEQVLASCRSSAP